MRKKSVPWLEKPLTARHLEVLSDLVPWRYSCIIAVWSSLLVGQLQSCLAVLQKDMYFQQRYYSMCSYSISTLQAKCIQICIHPQKTLLSRGRKPLRSRPLQPHNFFSCRCLSHTCRRRWHAGSPEHQGRKKTENTSILKQTRNYSQIRQLKIIPFPTCNIFQHCATLRLPK